MSTMEELSGEVKQKIQTVEKLYEIFKKYAQKKDDPADKLISQALDNGELTSFNFTGQVTDLSYFSQSDTMPLSAIRNIGDENIKEAVKQNFDKAAQQGLIELDGDNIKITAKGQDYISKPDFVKAAQADQTAAYQKSIAKMASTGTAENEVQMCAGLSGNYMNDFTVFNHTDKIDLSTVINHPDKKAAKQILSNVKKWQKGGFVAVKDGVATVTQQGKALLNSEVFKKAAGTPIAEKAVGAAGIPGKVIVATKKVVTAVAKAVQTAATTKKR